MGLEQLQVKLNPDVPPTGSDLSIVNAARRSFNARSDWDTYLRNNNTVGYRLEDKDKRLLQFLARGMTADDFESLQDEIFDIEDDGFAYHWLKEKLWQWRNTPTHASPFGHTFLSFEVMVPIWLARQLVKHKFLRWSEFSRRYITDDVDFYIHEYREASKNKKQGSGGPHPNSKTWDMYATQANEQQLHLYNSMIEDGVSPEQARGVLPADLMTAATWSGTLDAFADMCKLRLGVDAQKEAQYVAQQVYKYLEEYYPVGARSLVYGC